MTSKKLKLFASCIPVKGNSRSVICDLTRNSYAYVPNDLFDMLERYDGKSVAEIKDLYDKDSHEIIDEYVDFLINNEYCFLTSHPENYPPLSLQWHYPFEVSNAIIDYSHLVDMKHVLVQLDDICCKNLEVRFYDSPSYNVIEDILDYLKYTKSFISAIGFILPYNQHTEYSYYDTLVKKNPRISYIYFYNSPLEITASKNGVYDNIYFFSDTPGSELHCGLIHQKSFIVNIKSFTESSHHNSCLNKKISIDRRGDIKNCPSMKESYGNISTTTLKQALSHPDFKKYWNVTKNDIKTCQDCEFRFICTDCRAYTEDPLDPLSKPLKCGYSPYTNVWEEWSTNPLKQKAIEYYDMKELVQQNA